MRTDASNLRDKLFIHITPDIWIVARNTRAPRPQRGKRPSERGSRPSNIRSHVLRILEYRATMSLFPDAVVVGSRETELGAVVKCCYNVCCAGSEVNALVLAAILY